MTTGETKGQKKRGNPACSTGQKKHRPETGIWGNGRSNKGRPQMANSKPIVAERGGTGGGMKKGADDLKEIPGKARKGNESTKEPKTFGVRKWPNENRMAKKEEQISE